MKKIALTMCAVLLVAFAFGQQLASNEKPAKFVANENAVFNWTSTTYDFGKIKVGVPVTYDFTFKNSGTVPLVISSVQASCGCTVTSYSKDPIEPAGKGFVKATYNAARVGQFTKTVTVNANTQQGLVQLTIKGEVVE
ncbi:MAG: DUF1573 domain-containing protein [Bacteroidota bacterium]